MIISQLKQKLGKRIIIIDEKESIVLQQREDSPIYKPFIFIFIDDFINVFGSNITEAKMKSKNNTGGIDKMGYEKYIAQWKDDGIFD